MYPFWMFGVDLDLERATKTICLQFCWPADYHKIIIKTGKNKTFREETQIFNEIIKLLY